MNLAPLIPYLLALVHASTNNTALALSDATEPVSHDAFTRRLHQLMVTSVLTRLVSRLSLTGGFLILDDTILEKFTARLGCVFKLKDTKTGGFVLGLNVVLLVWSDGKRRIPLAFRINAGKGVSKFDLALQLLRFAHDTLKLEPQYVLFDSWYAAAKVLNLCRAFNWHFVTRLRKNRVLCGKQLRVIHRGLADWAALGLLRGSVAVVVYRHGSKFFASSDLGLTREEIRRIYSVRAGVEEVIRRLKQECGWQGCQARGVRSYRSHLTVGVIGLLLMERESRVRRSSVYKLRRRLISGRVRLEEGVVREFLTAA